MGNSQSSFLKINPNITQLFFSCVMFCYLVKTFVVLPKIKIYIMKSSINSIFGIVLLSNLTPIELLFYIALIITGIGLPLLGSFYRVFLRQRVQRFLQSIKDKYNL